MWQRCATLTQSLLGGTFMSHFINVLNPEDCTRHLLDAFPISWPYLPCVCVCVCRPTLQMCVFLCLDCLKLLWRQRRTWLRTDLQVSTHPLDFTLKAHPQLNFTPCCSFKALESLLFLKAFIFNVRKKIKEIYEKKIISFFLGFQWTSLSELSGS